MARTITTLDTETAFSITAEGSRETADSISTVAGRLYLVSMLKGGGADLDATPSCAFNGSSLSMAHVTNIKMGTNSEHQILFAGVATANSSGTFTITANGTGTWTRYVIIVDEAADSVGAIPASPIQQYTTRYFEGTTGSDTYDSGFQTDSWAYAVFGNNTPAAITPQAGWTEPTGGEAANAQDDMASQYLDGSDTDATCSFGSYSQYTVIAIEVLVGVAGGYTVGWPIELVASS